MAILGLVVLFAGCSGPAQPAPPEAEGHTVAWDLPARGASELNFLMEENATIMYSIAPGGAITWDLHSHAADGAVVTYARGEAPVADASFTAPAAGTYSIYVRARDAPATVEATIRGEFVLKEA